MKTLLACLILSSACVYGETSIVPGNLTSLDYLIKATEQQHALQVALREEIVEYEKVREQYLENTGDKELLARVVNRASRVSEQIKAAKLTHVFDADFLKELNLFAKFAKKK